MRNLVVGVFASAALIAPAMANQRTFSGTAVIENTTTQCSPYFASDGSFNVTYRYKNVSSDLSDALTFLTDRSVFRVESADLTGSLNGSVQVTQTKIDSRSNLFTAVNDSVNLSISSVGGNPVSSAVNVKIVGTLNDAFVISGCTLTIHALLVLRPIQ